MTQNFYVMPAPARIENFQPHMHMRGKAMSMEAVYPDGKRELLSSVNNFQWKWHVNYVFADDAAPLLPKGTMLVFTAWHDNTAANPNNPGSEAVGRLGRPHRRRDGARVGRRHVSRTGGVRHARGGAKSKGRGGEEGSAVATLLRSTDRRRTRANAFVRRPRIDVHSPRPPKCAARSDVAQRIRVEQHEIRELSRSDRAD